MTRAGDAPEGGTSYTYVNPNYPQEGIKLPPYTSLQDTYERLQERHLRDFHGEGQTCTSPSCAWFASHASR
ncbi:MAG: hypothetical protein KGL39_51740 [Patescibacteria group bacterium]|nr:hypothetical protein [Patescibacteria group bacterium]